MELAKRKREDDRGANAKRGKEAEDHDGSKGPADEEVEEFFAILKRIRVAVKYFRDRNDYRYPDRELKAVPWSLEFEREDFDGVKKETEGSDRNRSAGLDLNSDPACDASDHAD